MRRFNFISIFLLFAFSLEAQGIKRLFENSSFSGRIQTDVQYCIKDSANDVSPHVDRFLSQTYIDGTYTSRMLSAGLRFEMYENPLPGFDADYKGLGVPHFYLTLKLDKVTVTGGDFYEQFGGGLVLRTYEDRSLGIDNALRGGRVTYNPFPWMHLKVIVGVQRNRWQWSRSWVKGGDLELDMDQWFAALRRHNRTFQFGVSMVSKNESDELILGSPGKRLNLPANVSTFATRLRYSTSRITLQGEYAYKINDPSADNGFIYRPGQALVFSASYSHKGLGFTLSAKHADNMSFRSERTALGNVYQLNYLPAFTRQHTYALPGLYPYATQLNGEVAFQADAFYKFARGTVLGGKYGMDIRLNYSQLFSLDRTYPDTPPVHHSSKGTYGYTTSLFAIGGETYYRDFNLEISRRFNSDLKLTATYINLLYNRVVTGKAGLVYAHIGVIEALGRLSKKVVLRGELQYLATRQDEGDWVALLAELSFFPHWMVTLSDLYNWNEQARHYPMASVAYTTGAHRVSISGGLQRAGYNCSGGVCRYVPGTQGFALSYTTNF